MEGTTAVTAVDRLIRDSLDGPLSSLGDTFLLKASSSFVGRHTHKLSTQRRIAAGAVFGMLYGADGGAEGRDCGAWRRGGRVLTWTSCCIHRMAASMSGGAGPGGGGGRGVRLIGKIKKSNPEYTGGINAG